MKIRMTVEMHEKNGVVFGPPYAPASADVDRDRIFENWGLTRKEFDQLANDPFELLIPK